MKQAQVSSTSVRKIEAVESKNQEADLVSVPLPWNKSTNTGVLLIK